MGELMVVPGWSLAHRCVKCGGAEIVRWRVAGRRRMRVDLPLCRPCDLRWSRSQPVRGAALLLAFAAGALATRAALHHAGGLAWGALASAVVGALLAARVYRATVRVNAVRAGALRLRGVHPETARACERLVERYRSAGWR